MQALFAQPRGFCAGVDRAIEIVDEALKRFGAPVYVRHEIVHNRYVVEQLRQRGAIFIDKISEVPDKALLIFSAHGVSQAVRQCAKLRGLHIIDATCPLVNKVHREVLRQHVAGKQVILIGHAGHPEVEGTMGQLPHDAVLLISQPEDVEKLQINDEQALAYVTQTTLSVDDTADVIAALQQRFASIAAPKREDICYATSNRQAAVKTLAKSAQVVLVIGSVNSSNSNRLREVAERAGVAAYLIDGAEDIKAQWLIDIDCVGITAGASAPEVLVQGVIKWLQDRGCTNHRTLRVMDEAITFQLPDELR
ncbi:MAG: 4-hydroxy-3-methylbut-2-enyl diphosphate reductase [Mariprofundales bacterium]